MASQLIQQTRRANITEMPDFIRVARQIENYRWQFVVRIGENKNTQCLLASG